MRTYTELSMLPTFEERYDYLKLSAAVGKDTFGFDRYLNQTFYKTPEWKRIRDLVIIRDNGCDLGVEGFDIVGKALIHHMNPIAVQDILDRSDILLNPEYLICTSYNTHNAIHYGDKSALPLLPKERTKNDTCPWKL